MLQLVKQGPCQAWLLFEEQSRVILIDRIFFEEEGGRHTQSMHTRAIFR